MPDARTFHYCGKYLGRDNRFFKVNEAFKGYLEIPLEDLRIVRKMTRIDWLNMANKSDRFLAHLKFQQLDDKIKRNLEEFVAKIHEVLGFKGKSDGDG
jgi:hypothetical protein